MEKIDSQDFREKVYFGDNRCAVLFTAPWCGFCNSMKLMLEKVRNDFASTDFFLVDIDEEKELGKEYSVSAVPTLIIFREGKVQSKATGLLKKTELYTLLGAKVAVE